MFFGENKMLQMIGGQNGLDFNQMIMIGLAIAMGIWIYLEFFA